jgi:hypothetical protein
MREQRGCAKFETKTSDRHETASVYSPPPKRLKVHPAWLTQCATDETCVCVCVAA